MQNRTVNTAPPRSALPGNNLSLLKNFNGKPITANGLRNGLYKAISRLPLNERVPVYRKLISELEKAGINVGSRLFLLGIPAAIPEELTPNDVGKLLRSVYLSEPQAITAISETLSQVLSSSEEAKANQKSLPGTPKRRK